MSVSIRASALALSLALAGGFSAAPANAAAAVRVARRASSVDRRLGSPSEPCPTSKASAALPSSSATSAR